MSPEVTVADKLELMYQHQQEFIGLLQKMRGHAPVPFDLSDKRSQQQLRNLAYECMGELFEANILLKNSKSHRATNIAEFDRDAYLEELTDVLHYFLGIVICSGISVDELFQKFMEKGETNFSRIRSGY
jgi:predicted house-cleaning noncanonical NTP pyrophosphatase (MazG superfamily)